MRGFLSGMCRGLALPAAWAALLAMPAHAAPARPTITLAVHGKYTRLILQAEDLRDFRSFRLDRPPRFVLDLMGVRTSAEISGLDLKGTLILGIRQGLKRDRLRVVLDLLADVPVHVHRTGGKPRLIVDVIRPPDLDLEAAAPPPPSRSEAATPGIRAVARTTPKPPSPGAAAPTTAMSAAEQAELHGAVEDFRFGDYQPAIAVLQRLRRTHPRHHDVLSTLAMALEESGRTEEAIPVYAAWRRAFPAERDAWLGSGRVLMKAGRHEEAAALLKTWIAGHGADMAARLMRVNALLQAGRRDAAGEAAAAVLRHASAEAEDRAAAHYYLAYLAAARGDIALARAESKAALRETPEGGYAGQARQLLRGIEAGLGWSGSLVLQGFYSSNVSLLPEPLRQNILLRPDPNRPAADAGLLADVVLSYRWPSWIFTYAFNGQFYRRRTDLNLLPHIVSLGWLHGDWTVAPRFEWIQFGKDFLYSGGGVDVTWAPSGWLLRYGLDVKSFNKAYLGASDLSRLDGTAHDAAISYTWDRQVQRWTIGATGHVELTKGDATHRGSDSYRQIGATTTWWRHFSLVDAQVSLQVYRRRYRSPDVTILAAGYSTVKRRDTYLQAAADFAFHPFRGEHHALVAKASWQRNRSNYRQPVVDPQDGKTFTEWRVSGGWQWRF